MIYAIEAIGTGFIKFGRAKSVSKRLRELEVGSPFELGIVAAANWPDGAETAIHRYLAKNLERGEWFIDTQLTRQVMEWMNHHDSAVGLESLWMASGAKAREEESSTAQALVIARAQENKFGRPARTLTRDERRRLERVAWWNKHAARQRSSAAISLSGARRIVIKTNASVEDADPRSSSEVATTI